MRVAYLLTWQHGALSGVFAKVSDQVRAWDRLGVETGLFVATSRAAADDWRALPQAAQVMPFKGVVGSVRTQSGLLTAIRDWRPDITYVRTSPRQASAARQLHRIPHVIEIQSDDLAEFRLAPLPRRVLTLATRRSCHAGATGLVFVSRELAESPSYAFATRNRIVIGNGIDLDRVSVLPPAPADAPTRLAFIGHPGVPWHGIDEVYRLAQARPDWGFDIIGAGPAQVTTAPPNVVLHGEMSSEEYVPILARATVGLGTLALHAKSMNEASPLKSREYLARGLPVIGAYVDTDIPDGSPYFLRLPNVPYAITDHLNGVEAFVDAWRGRRVQHDEIGFLDAARKEAIRLDFLRACARSAAP